MAEPSVRPAAPDSAGADALLATKLYVPRLRAGFVPRPRLVARLDEGLGHGGLVLACAPAGFGKTSLLADWSRAGRLPVAWLSLDPGDNDPARFWRHAVASLDRVLPGAAERVLPLLGPPAPPTFDGLVTALINELAAAPDSGALALVLDDYHLIEADPVHSSLAFLVDHMPPGLRLVLASRADPQLPLARLRARGQLTELRAAELRFTAGEAAALLREAAGPGQELPDAVVAALAARTEGWVAGLQLAGLSLSGQPDLAGFVSAFSGSNRYVLDFLAQEVLDHQPDEMRVFLLETSILDRLSGELCDAVTGRADGQQMLEQVERASLFLVPLDEVRGWWRYHQLFADLLRARLQQEQPDRVPALHRQASAWCEQHRLADDSVRHALAAGDAVRAARLIEQHVDELILRSEAATIGRWLAALPPGLAATRPRLCLAQVFVAVTASDLDSAEVPLDAAEHALAQAQPADEPFEPSVGTGASLLANVPATIALERAVLAHLRGDAGRTAAFAEQALAALGEGEWMLESILRWHLAVAEWLRGRLPEAERAFTASISRWREASEPTLAAWGGQHLGQVQRARGRLTAALGTYEQLRELTAPPGRTPLPASCVAWVGLAEVAWQRGELDTALAHVTEGIARGRQFAYTQTLANGLAVLAWIRLAGGDQAGALAAMAEAAQILPGAGVTSLLNPVPAERARLLLACGDVQAAASWAAERALGPDDELSYQAERDHLVLARLLLARGRPDEAARLLGRLGAAAAGQQRAGSEIEIGALQALAQAACGDQAAAVDTLARALLLGYPEGYLRVFADEGTAMADLLGSLAAAQRAGTGPAAEVPLGYLGQLARAFRPDAAAATGSAPAAQARASSPAPGLVEPLSEREAQVLQLLAEGRPNQEIAAELVVSLHTVKKHVSHILAKLGAANRTEATARARELGLLR